MLLAFFLKPRSVVFFALVSKEKENDGPMRKQCLRLPQTATDLNAQKVWVGWMDGPLNTLML